MSSAETSISLRLINLTMKESRIEQEKIVVERMIYLYCSKKEKNKKLCPFCRELLLYARSRLEHCPFGEDKSSCRICAIHCYRPDMRARMQAVMRYSGPRMMFYHPLDAFLHIWTEHAFRFRQLLK